MKKRVLLYYGNVNEEHGLKDKSSEFRAVDQSWKVVVTGLQDDVRTRQTAGLFQMLV